MSTELAHHELMTIDAGRVTHTMEMLKTIRSFVGGEMVDGLDFGTIPGTGTKKVMLLPGAQKVAMLYNSYPRYEVQASEFGGGHVEFRVTTELVNRATDAVVGSGVGSCSTMESKYRYRNAARKCPQCGKESIIKGKAEYGGGWLCWKKKDGCGATFTDTDPNIVDQVAGRVENTDIHDVRNTVLKMAKKRSMVDACVGLGCLAELFTQDLEEEHPVEPPKPAEPAKKNGAPEKTDPAVAKDVELWTGWLTQEHTLDSFNGSLTADFPTIPKAARTPIWIKVLEYAVAHGWELDRESKKFREVAHAAPAGGSTPF